MGLSSLRTPDSNFFLDKLKSFLSYRFSRVYHNIDNNLCFQADHISLTPGKKHNVKIFGSQISTNRNPSTWKFEGRLLLSLHVQIWFMGIDDDFLKAFCKWKAFLHQQGVVDLHGRQTHSVTTQGNVDCSSTNS